jgi:hypothetical protein
MIGFGRRDTENKAGIHHHNRDWSGPSERYGGARLGEDYNGQQPLSQCYGGDMGMQCGGFEGAMKRSAALKMSPDFEFFSSSQTGAAALSGPVSCQLADMRQNQVGAAMGSMMGGLAGNPGMLPLGTSNDHPRNPTSMVGMRTPQVRSTNTRSWPRHIRTFASAGPIA